MSPPTPAPSSTPNWTATLEQLRALQGPSELAFKFGLAGHAFELGYDLFRHGRFDTLRFQQPTSSGQNQSLELVCHGTETGLVRFRASRDQIYCHCECMRFSKRGNCEHQFCGLLVLWCAIQYTQAPSEEVRYFLAMQLPSLQEKLKLMGDALKNWRLEQTPQVKWVALIYCPYPLPASTWRDQISNLRDAVQIQPEYVGTSYLLSDRWTPSTVPASNVPSIFRARPAARSSWYAPTNPIFDLLHYQFSDGTILNSNEIFYHAYGAKLDPNHLPTIESVRKIKKSLRDQTQLSNDVHESRLAAFGVAQNALSSGLAVIWTSSPDKKQIRQGIPLKKMDTITDSKDDSLRPQWLLHCTSPDPNGKASFELRFGNKEKKLWNYENVLFDPSTQELYWTSCTRQLQIWSELQQHFVNTTSDWYRTMPVVGSQLVIRGHEQIQLATEILRDLHAKTPYRLEGLVDLPHGPSHATIDLDDTGRFAFTLSMNDGTDRSATVHDLPWLAKLIAGVLSDGICFGTNGDAKYFADRNDKSTRTNDLLLMKHAGMAAYVLNEIFNYFLDRKSSDETTLADRNALNKHLANRIDQFARAQIKEGTHFSPSLLKLVESFIDAIENEIDHRPIQAYCPAGIVHFPDGKLLILRVYRALLNELAFKTRGECFLKPRVTVLPELCEALTQPTCQDIQFGGSAHRYPLESSDPSKANDKGFAQSALSRLASEGFMVTYKGRPVQRFGVEDLNSELRLVENSTHSPNAPGPTKKIDWFELHPQFFFKGVEISLEAASKLAQTGIIDFDGKLYVINDRSFTNQKRAWNRLEAFWARLSAGAKIGGDPRFAEYNGRPIHRLPKNQTLELLALRASGVEVSGGEKWREICEFYDALDSKRSPLQTPASLNVTLKDYQTVGVQWLYDLYRLELGGILADDMGLGKTVQILAFLEILRNQSRMRHALIVVPTSLTFNWEQEGKRFAPELPLVVFQSKDKDKISRFLGDHPHAAVVCTYGLLVEQEEFFAGHEWNIHIYDEAQNLKNITTQRTSACRRLPAKFKVCLTGTPLENHLGEFYSLLDLCVPGSLGDLDRFNEVYVRNKPQDSESVAHLRLKVKPLVLRRRKSEILLELLDKTESTVMIDFEPKQKKIYRDIALAWNDKIRDSILKVGEARSQLMILTALLRLRQACSDPSIIPGISYRGDSPKLRILIEALKDITDAGESALVFTQFLGTFERIESALKRAGIAVHKINGNLSKNQREAELQAFTQNPQGAVMLMTLKSGGVGLNLIKASYVFHIEPWWNPAVENQATDRAHRIGQEKPVQVYRYLMHESVEEKIQLLKASKSLAFNALFGHVESEAEATREFEEGKPSQGPRGHRLSQTDFEFLVSS